MKRLQPVIWTKGTFLSPQHLQIQDRFLENLLQFQLESLSFRPWGFAHSQISQEGSGGRSADHLFSAPGYCPTACCSIFRHPTPRRRSKQLADCFEPDQTSLDLYLAVPQYRERGLNVATYRAGRRRALPRRNRAVPRRKHRPFGKARAGGPQESAPAGRRRGSRRLLHPARGARPPHRGRHISVGPALRAAAARISTPAIIWSPSPAAWWKFSSARSSGISGMRRQKNQSLADFTAADIANFWLLYTINTAFPDLPPPLRNARRPSRSALFRHALAGRSADHLLAPQSIRAICPPTITRIWAPASPNWTRSCACCWKPWCPAISSRCR